MQTLRNYILKQFIANVILVLVAACTLFLVFDFFERSKTFVREGTSVWLIINYLSYQIPLVIHLMTPIAMLLATLITVGKLSQTSEITAMRACGVSLSWLFTPLLSLSLLVALVHFISAETLVPYSARKVKEVYRIDIRQDDLKGNFDRGNFWFRQDNYFFYSALYDAKSSTLKGLSVYELLPNKFGLKKTNRRPRCNLAG